MTGARVTRSVGVLVVAGVLGAGIYMVTTRGAGVGQRILPTSARVEELESARREEGAAVREISLTAAPATIDLGDRSVKTWAFNGSVPGPEIRLRAGDVLRAAVSNRLPEPLTIHWHGLALRNDMDGVPDVTQEPIAPGGKMIYEFTAPDPGTFFYHPHTGTQLDRGLYGPLIVEERDPDTTAAGDVTVMLDDWIDGTGETPDDVLARLRRGGSEMDMDSGMADMDSGMDDMDSGMDDMDSGMDDMDSPGITNGDPLGEDTGDVAYPLYLINGRSAEAPASFDVPRDRPVRLRLINAASDTPFRVAVAGARMQVVATDGFAVAPVSVDALLLGMGERYDVIIELKGSGTFPLVAVAEGKNARTLALLRTGRSLGPERVPDPKLDGDLLSLEDLRAESGVAFPQEEPDRTYRLSLTADMSEYRWGIDAPEEDGVTLPVREGERVRLVFENRTMMWHPMHLHGQTFQVVTGTWPGPRKDTVIVPAMGSVAIDVVADNPGQWALHCHNLYHQEAGMMTTFSYVE